MGLFFSSNSYTPFKIFRQGRFGWVPPFFTSAFYWYITVKTLVCVY
jgi:hypothetical protein